MSSKDHRNIRILRPVSEAQEKGIPETTWKASSLQLWATLDILWATLGYSGLLFWATWRSRHILEDLEVYVVFALPEGWSVRY